MARFPYPSHRQPAHVTFGTGSVRALVETGLDRRTVIFVTPQVTVRSAVDESWSRRGLSLDRAVVVEKPAGEPDREAILIGSQRLREHGSVERLVGLGGGSVLDWARLSWLHACGALDLETGRVRPQALAADRPEIWLIPTTCATGAEAAAVAVYTDRGRKVPVVSPALLASRVVLDGQFLKDAPPATLACWLGDLLSHAIEAFCSIVPGTLAKESAVSALRLVLDEAGAPQGSSRNERLMEAGYLAGVAASNCSVGIVHAFAHTIAGTGVPHGYANAVALPAGLSVNRDVPALEVLARRAGCASAADLSSAAARIVSGARAGDAGTRVRDALATIESRRDVAARMAADGCMRTNPFQPSAEQVERFLSDVLRSVEER
jgi:alcohol dehydrogenase class IV